MFLWAVFFLLLQQSSAAVEVVSDPGHTMSLTYSLNLQGGESVCVEGFGEGYLQYINTTTSFSSMTASLAVDTFGVEVMFADADEFDCIMLGDSSASNCSHHFEWPSFNSDSATNGATTFTLTDVQSASYDKGVGDYRVCFYNSASSSTISSFNGTVDLLGLATESVSVLNMSEVISSTLEASFDINIRQAQSICSSSIASGMLQFVNVTVNFVNGDSSKFSDEFVLGLHHKMSGECVQFGPSLEGCKYLRSWPSFFQNSSNGLYTALLDVQEFEFSFNEGMEYTVCIGNADLLTDDPSSYSQFEGNVQFYGLTIERENILSVTSEIGEIPLTTTFDLRARQEQSLCTSVFAMGQLQYINVTVDFVNGDSSWLSEEFIAGIYHMETGRCIQFGPGLEECEHQQAWPEHFHNNTSGLYTTLVDVQAHEFAFNEGMEYKVCLGNADRLTDDPMAYSEFVGDVELYGFTKERESTVSVTSEIGEIPLTTTFDLRARQEQSLCTSVFAMGQLQYINVTVDFVNGDSSWLSEEFIAGIYHMETGRCIQFGPGLEECEHQQAWPEHFHNNTSGLYTTLVDVRTHEFAFNEGMEYKVCLGNADRLTDDPMAYSEFVGDVELYGFTKERESTVSVTSEIGEIPLTTTFDLRARQEQSLCTSVFAMGQLQYINVTVDFVNGDSSWLSEEFIAGIYHMETGRCIQFGPGLEECEHQQAWPEHFHNNTSGLYTTLVDVRTHEFAFNEGMEYKVCLGNADRLTDDPMAYSEFVGDVELYGFTKERESTVSVTSEIGEIPLTTTFDLRARQEQSLCTSVFAMGQLQYINVTVDFVNGDSSWLSEEFIAGIYHMETGRCIQFGPGLEECEHQQAWPEHFHNNTSGLYTTLVDVRTHEFAFNEGMEYKVCLGNADRLTDDPMAYSEFVGDVELYGFTKERESTVSVTSEIGEIPLTTTFDLRARQEQSLCTSVFAMGQLQYINVTVDFVNGDSSWLSEEFIAGIYHMETGRCIQFGPGLEECEHQQAWPEHFHNNTSGLYTTLVDVRTHEFAFNEGMEYKVCLGNADRLTDDPMAYSEFVGDVELYGFTKERESTVSVTSEIGEIPLTTTFDLRARQEQSLCTSVFAMGQLQYINVTVDFVNGDSSWLSEEFIAGIYHMETGRCIQFGPGLEECEHQQAWPEHFHNNTSGLYTTLVDVRTHEFAFNEGMEYKVCLGNADRLTDDPMAYSEFVGDVELYGFTKERESTVSVTSEIGEIPLTTTFDLRARQEQSLCTSVFAMGQLQYINVTVDFVNGDSSWLSEEFIAGIYHMETGRCIQFGPGLEECEHQQAWPEHFHNNTSGLYTTLVDVRTHEFAFNEGMEYKVCLGNADRLTDDPMAYSEFVGDVELYGFTKERESTVSVTSEIGEIPLTTTFDLRARQEQSLCTSVFAMGQLQYINVTVDFVNGDSSWLSEEFIAGIYHMETGRCIQFGPGLEECEHQQAWPEHFHNNTSGLYTTLVDVQAHEFAFNEGMEYKVCLGNADRLTDDPMAYSEFVGDVELYGFTKERESTVSVTSEIGEIPLTTTFDLRARQEQSLCTSVFAMGQLQYINVTVDFVNGDSSWLSEEFIAGIYHMETGRCIQFGPGLEECEHQQAWPEHFHNNTSGLYTTLVDVRTHEFAFNEGMEYKVCLGNADRLTDDPMAYSEFVGDVELYGFTKERESTVSVTSEIGEIPLTTTFDLRARQEQSLCTSVFAMGQLLYINVTVDFVNGDSSWLSEEFIAGIYHMETGRCIQFGPGLEECEHQQAWPEHFHNNTSGLYTTLVDVQAHEFAFNEGMEYKVCLGNADRLTDDPMAYSEFVGDVELYGFTKERESTVSVTSEIGEIPLTTTFDLRARQEQSLCTSVFAMGQLQYINVTVDFVNGDSSWLSEEFIAGIYHMETGRCIQFGPGLEECEHQQAWPEHFHNNTSGLYTTLVDVQAHEFAFNEGMEYKVCLGNADRLTDDPMAYSEFVGDVELYGFTKERESTVSVTSEIGEIPLTTTFDLRARQEQSLCTSVFAMGQLQYINVTVDFVNGDSSWLSEEFIAGIYHMETGRCIQFGPGLEECEHQQAWPEHFHSSSSGIFVAKIDVQAFDYFFYEGMEYKVCLGNADRLTDDPMAYSEFVGDVEFWGMTKERENVVEISSGFQEDFGVMFDLRARQEQSLCTGGFATGNLTNVSVTVDFTNGDLTMLGSEFVIGIYHVDSESCVQIGPALAACSIQEAWPSNFQTHANGEYSATIDIDGFSFSSNEPSLYKVCVGNAEPVSNDPYAYSYFVGSITFMGLTSSAEYFPTLQPTFPIESSSDSGLDDSEIIMLSVLVPVGCLLIALLFFMMWWKNVCGIRERDEMKEELFGRDQTKTGGSMDVHTV